MHKISKLFTASATNPPPPSTTAYPPESNRYPYHDNQEPPPPPRHNTIFNRPLTKAEEVLQTFLFFSIIAIATWIILVFYGFPIFNSSPPPEVSIKSLSFSNFNSTPSTNGRLINATWDVRFTFHNVNGKSKSPITSLNDVVSTVFYKKYFLAQVTVPPFVLGNGANDSTVEVDVSLWAGDYYVDGWVVDGIETDRSRYGTVKFDFEVAVAWNRGRDEWLNDEARCEDVTLSGVTGKLLIGRPRCKWQLDRWVY